MYTKEQMIEGGECAGRVDCLDCPFEKLSEHIFFKAECYQINKARYLKEKEMEKIQKDPLTYKSLALVINHEIRICHKNMEPHEWISIRDDGKWRDNNAIVYSPVFSRIEDWTYWTEPKEEFKPYSVDVWLNIDRPEIHKEDKAFIDTKVFGEDVVYSWKKTTTTPHKFKITIEKAEE